MIKLLSFCELNFQDNIVICKVFEGETVTQANSNHQTKVILNYFKDKPFVYITHRINSYSVDPNIYSNTSNIDNLLGFVVVSSNFASIKNALFEKLFLNKPFVVFNTLERAINWSKKTIEKHVNIS
ncbi:hypothetical protein [Lacinutrix salivirga]